MLQSQTEEEVYTLYMLRHLRIENKFTYFLNSMLKMEFYSDICYSIYNMTRRILTPIRTSFIASTVKDQMSLTQKFTQTKYPNFTKLSAKLQKFFPDLKLRLYTVPQNMVRFQFSLQLITGLILSNNVSISLGSPLQQPPLPPVYFIM